MYVVTGGAGFIGSNIVAALDGIGKDVVVIDTLEPGNKSRNLAKRQHIDIVSPSDTFLFLERCANTIEGVIHMAAISDTTAKDINLLISTNFKLSCELWGWCARQNVTFVFASSAATYGDGSAGFDGFEDRESLAKLRPLNAYGRSKHMFDCWISRQIETDASRPLKWAGLKFFNVYGPNEYHKGSQRSVALQIFDRIAEGKPIELFESNDSRFENGGQMRDFVWVGDCVRAVFWLMNTELVSGIFNMGTGQARSFNDLVGIIYSHLNAEEKIKYVPMPNEIQGKYQNFTQANMSKLKSSGLNPKFKNLEKGLGIYIKKYLLNDDKYL